MKLACTLLLAAALAGCASYTGYLKPEPVVAAPDTYRFKFLSSSFGGGEPSDAKVVDDLEAFKVAHGYASYAIVSRLQTPVPWSADYLVRFSR